MKEVFLICSNLLRILPHLSPEIAPGKEHFGLHKFLIAHCLVTELVRKKVVPERLSISKAIRNRLSAFLFWNLYVYSFCATPDEKHSLRNSLINFIANANLLLNF